MKSYIIKGGNPLWGEVEINGGKNAALPVLAAALLTEEECEIHNVPKLSDIKNILEILRGVGCFVEKEKDVCKIKAGKPLGESVPYEFVNKFRASFLVAGPLLARTGKVTIPLPGGCQIGARPIDLHLKGFAAMGAKVEKDHGFVHMECERLQGAEIYLDFPSVGATENLMMAASLANGETVIGNAAAEPEIINLADFINAMGGEVTGAGTDTVKIAGKECLAGAKHNVIPDRIEAGTFAFAAAATRGNVLIKNIIPDHLKPVVAKLEDCGVKALVGDDSIRIDATGGLISADIKTMPYPGFPTDLQAPYVAMMCVAQGTSMVVETIFENRFLHVPELNRMGANVKVDGRTAVIEGRDMLTGARVAASDLRAGAALVIAGLSAKGETLIDDISYIERGYSDFVGRIAGLNGSITLQNQIN